MTVSATAVVDADGDKYVFSRPLVEQRARIVGIDRHDEIVR